MYSLKDYRDIYHVLNVSFCFRKSRNLLEAASSGASSSIKLIANIAVNLMAFIALLAFVDATLSWIGTMVDHPELSFRVCENPVLGKEMGIYKASRFENVWPQIKQR